MSVQDFNTIKEEVKSRLTYLNSTYLNSIDEPVFGGGANNMIDLFNFSSTTANTTYVFRDSNTANTGIAIFTNNSYTNNININTINTYGYDITEINCLNMLDFTNLSSRSLFDKIYSLYTLYAVLDASYFDSFVSNTQNNIPYSPLKIPVCNDNSLVDFVYIHTVIGTQLNRISSTLINNIINIPNFNAFIARRIVYMWILMFHFSIAYNYYLKEKTNQDRINLVLKCIKLLQKNNDQFGYQSVMDNAVQQSPRSEAAMLTYQLWCMIVQILVPSTLGNFDPITGTITAIKSTDTCTNINPELAINNIEEDYKALIGGYSSLVDDSGTPSPIIINNLKKALNLIIDNIHCNNSITADNTAAKTAATINKAAVEATVSTNLTNKNTAANKAIASKADADAAFSTRETRRTELITAQNATKIPKAQSLVGINDLDISTKRSFTTSPTGINVNSPPVYTFSFDITIAQDSPSWRSIMVNGDNDIQRYPAIFLSGTAQGTPNRVHIVHYTTTNRVRNFGLTGRIAISKNTPTTVTVVVANGTMWLYINGVIDVSVTSPNDDRMVWNPTKSMNWQWNHNNNNNNGSLKVKNVNWWNIPLNQGQIQLYVNDKTLATVEPVVATAQTNFNNADKEYTRLNALYNSHNEELRRYTTIYNASLQLLRNAINLLDITKNPSIISTTKSITFAKLNQQTKTYLDATKTAYSTTATIARGDISNEELYDIKSSISQNITTYRDRQSKINSLEPVVRKNKDSLKNTQLQLTGRQEQANTLKKYEYVALTILLLITIFAFIIIIMPLDKSMKIMLTMLLTIIVIVNAYMLQTVFNTTKMEKFGSLQQGNDDISVATINYMDAASSYLLQTETLNIMLQSNAVYNNTNESLSKELTYFNDVSDQLVNSNDKVSSVYKSSYITQVQYSSAIQLFKTLSVVVAGFTIAYVALESLDITGSAYMWISCIAGFLIVIAIIIYALEVSTRVRTNPKQVYWGKAESKSF